MSRRATLAVVLAVGCSSSSPGPKVPPAAEDAGPPPLAALRLPADPGDLAPAHMQIEASAERLADVETCKACHPDVVRQWQSSAHAFSSFSNPYYRVSVDGFRDSRGHQNSRFCAGCHDPVLLASGGMDRDIDPADPMSHAGVTCLVCHGARRATVDGNASLTVDLSAVVIPEPGDDSKVAAHKRSVKPLGVELCASCHRSFTSDEMGHATFLQGMDDFGAWRASAFSGSGIARVDSAPRARCRDCHMRPERADGDRAALRGMVSSHRFAGGQSHLALLTGDAEQLKATRRRLVGAVTVDVAAMRGSISGWHRPAEDGALTPGETVELDIVVRNTGTGHRFPGGTTDALDSWVEVEVVDGKGEVVARSEEGARHVLRSIMLGADARPREGREVHEFLAPLVNHTVAPRGSAVVRFRWQVPEGFDPQAARVRARVLHRARNQTLVASICRESKTERGRAFAAGAARAGRRIVDACAPAPVTVVAKRELALGKNPDQGAFQRLYDHGEALLAQVQEHVDEARGSLEGAGKLAASERQRAQVAVAMARLEGRQGRFDEAHRWARRAEKLGARTPARAALATSAAQVWRWRIAAESWAIVTRAAPDNLYGWRGLAIALGSLGDDRGALRAARAGLAIGPRDPDLLRVQAVSARALGHPQAEAAGRAFERFRRPDAATRLRMKCAAEVEGCARVRMPVPVYPLSKPGP